jgi:type III pantothenate kinase
VVATGGLAPLIVAETSVFEITDPHLTLQGLRMIYALNPSPAAAMAPAAAKDGQRGD